MCRKCVWGGCGTPNGTNKSANRICFEAKQNKLLRIFFFYSRALRNSFESGTCNGLIFNFKSLKAGGFMGIRNVGFSWFSNVLDRVQ